MAYRALKHLQDSVEKPTEHALSRLGHVSLGEGEKTRTDRTTPGGLPRQPVTAAALQAIVESLLNADLQRDPA